MAVLSPEQLREARQSSGLTQEQVARKIGVTLRTVARAELGEGGFNVSTLHRIAQLYERPMESFLKCGHPTDGEADCVAAHPPSGGEAADGAAAA